MEVSGASEDACGYRACVYALASRVEGVRHAVLEAASPEVVVGAIEAIAEVDWSEAWKEGLEALCISPRLVVRPPFAAFELVPEQREVVIDPGQAFGTGGHASTRLALEWIDASYPASPSESGPVRVIDVGTGSGVLALAALVLGATSALGFDLDPVAVHAARQAAIDNGLGHRIALFAGGIEALATERARAPLVVANLLKREMLPIASAIAGLVAPGGRLVLSGLLESDAVEVLSCLGALGLVECEAPRTLDDATGRWIGLCLARAT